MSKDFVEINVSDLPTEHTISSVDFAQQATDLAYKLKNPSKFPGEELLASEKLVGTGWKILCDSSKAISTNKCGYKAVAFVNETSKEVHIATAGTVATNIGDLIDDALVAVQSVPYKIEQAKEMVTQVTSLLGEEAIEYSFSTSGHSLGAIISDLTGVEIISRGLNFNKSTTFDSPGSQAVVKKAIKDNLFTGKIEQSINDLAEHSEIYNAKPNFINGTNPQLGNVHIVLPNDTSVVKIEASITQSTGLWGWGSYLCSKIGSAVGVVANCLGITSVTEQIKNHSLKNFTTLEKSATVFLTENYQKIGSALVIKNDPTLAKITSTGNDALILDQKDHGSIVYITKNEYSFQDLSRAGTYSPCSMEIESTDLTGESVIFGDDWNIVY